MPEQLETGTHFDSHWGIYQTPMTVQLALNLGWEPSDRADLDLIVSRANHMMGMSVIEEWEHDILEEAYNEAEEWINDNCVPEGYWFGHHSDLGDIGVWEIEDE